MPRKTKDRDYAYRNIRSHVIGQPWLILQEKLQAIAQFMELKASGHDISQEDVRAVMSIHEPEARLADGEIRTTRGVHVMRLFDTLGPRLNLMMNFSGGTSTINFGHQFDRAIADDRVKAILIEVDSPGGIATGTQELSDKIFAARGEKPIHAVVRGSCASAAYWIASACDEVIATPSSDIGSIGAFFIHSEQSKAAAEAGIKYTVIKHGRFKAAGNDVEPLSRDDRDSIQERIDAVAGQFIAGVANNRGISAEAVATDYGQGKVFLAEDALRRGMIDQIASFDDAFAELAGDEPSRTATRTFITTPVREIQMTVTPKIKAGLFSHGLIDSMDASDESCQATITTWCKSRGLAVPSTEEDILKEIHANSAQVPTVAGDTAPIVAVTRTATPPGAGETIVTLTGDAEAERRGAIAERNRVKDIEARASLMTDVTDDMAREAIEAGLSGEDAVAKWIVDTTPVSGPVHPPPVPVGSNADQVTDAAIETLLGRVGHPVEKPTANAVSMRHMRLVEIGCTAIRASDGRPTGDPEKDALAFLKLGGESVEIMAGEPSGQRAGDFPNILSGLAGKVLDEAIELAETTYKLWTQKRPDAPDLKPSTINGMGGFDQLDLIQDDEPAPQLKMAEEATWIQPDRYANKVGLTPVMVTNDDLGAFSEGLEGLAEAHERTINILCVNILTANAALVDGTALFHADHNNLQDTGAAPSVAEFDAMRVLHMSQTGIGGIGFMRNPPVILLVPTALGLAAQQLVLPNASYHPDAVGNINVFANGTITAVIEPELTAASALIYYTFITPRRGAISHIFQRGYGSRGRRTTWFDPDRETRYVRLEGRMAAVARTHRGAVRNDGAA